MNVTADFIYDNAYIKMINPAEEDHIFYTVPYLDMIAYLCVKEVADFPHVITRKMFNALDINENVFLTRAKLNMIQDLNINYIEEFISFSHDGESGLIVVSNKKNFYGAGMIMIPEIFQRISNYDIFILPSSIHEVLALPDDGNVDVGYLQSLVRTVNSECVTAAERLTDSVYKYFHEDNKIKKVG